MDGKDIHKREIQIKQNILSQLDSLINENSTLLKKVHTQNVHLNSFLDKNRELENKNIILMKLVKKNEDLIEDLQKQNHLEIKKFKLLLAKQNKILIDKENEVLKLEELHTKIITKISKTNINAGDSDVNESIHKTYDKNRQKIIRLIVDLKKSGENSEIIQNEILDLESEVRAIIRVMNEIQAENLNYKAAYHKKEKENFILKQEIAENKKIINDLDSKVKSDSSELRKRYDDKVSEAIRDFEEKEIALRLRIEMLEKQVAVKRAKMDQILQEKNKVLELISENIKKIQ